MSEGKLSNNGFFLLEKLKKLLFQTCTLSSRRVPGNTHMQIPACLLVVKPPQKTQTHIQNFTDKLSAFRFVILQTHTNPETTLKKKTTCDIC